MKRQRGFTLMEIVVTLALAAIVIALVGSLFVFSLGAWRRGQDLRDAQVQASTLVDVIARDVRNASQAPSVTIRPGFELDEGDPLLAIAAAAPAGGAQTTPSDGPAWILYLLRRDEVLRQIVAPAQGPRVTVRDSRSVATGVAKIDVQQVAAGVTIVVEVRRGRATAQARATAAPRNP